MSQKLPLNKSSQRILQFVLNEVSEEDKAPLKALFQQGRSFSTFMFWIAFFMCLLMVYALGSWLPKLMIQAGYSLGASMIFLFALNIGGMVGAIGGGALADRFHIKKVLSIMFMCGALALILLGFNSPQMVLYTLIAVAGAATIGSQIPTLYLCRTILSNHGTFYRYGLGIGHWTNWCNRWTGTYWCAVNHEFAASNELLGDSHSRCHSCIGDLYGEFASVSRGIYSRSIAKAQYASYQKSSELSRYLKI